MFGNRQLKHLFSGSAFATLIVAAALSFDGSTPLAARSVETTPVSLMAVPSIPAPASAEAKEAAFTFVAGLSQADADVVWRFATEGEQEAFADPDETFAAFVDAYPPLANAKEVRVERTAADGDMEQVTLTVTDRHGLQWQAELGLWKDDAGDWKILSLDIRPAPGELA